MKILVCISNVPDTTTKIKLAEGNSSIDTAGIQWVINPWDELSLTRALELKEVSGGVIKSVTVAHVGPASSEPTIRKALAIGADDAVRVNLAAKDAYSVAFELSEVIRNDAFDIIMCGIESSDFNGSAVGGMISEFLGIPSVSSVSGVSFDNGAILITREFDGGKETVKLPLPFAAVVQKGIAKEPRIASMRGIMSARTKQIRVVEPAGNMHLTEVVSYEKPAPRAACRFVDPENPAQLIELLQNEARVL